MGNYVQHSIRLFVATPGTKISVLLDMSLLFSAPQLSGLWCEGTLVAARFEPIDMLFYQSAPDAI